MSSRKPNKSPLLAEKNGALPLRKTGIKQAPPDLAEFIRLANLVPDGTWLPAELEGANGTWAELLEGIHGLRPDVGAELFERSKLVKPALEEASLEEWRHFLVLSHYEKIRVAYYNIRGLTRGTGGIDIDPLNELLQALGHADLSRLRQCKKADCGMIFYAGKRTQPGCSPGHSSAIRQQRKRNRDKAARESKKELAAGKKRAQTASKR